MPIFVRDAGVWKETEPFVRDAGVWKPLDTGHVRDAGVWKEFYASGFDPSTPLGTFIEGGYYIGTINDGGQNFALILAPKSSGQSILQWKTSNSATAGTQSETNGLANCNNMNNASHPAAQWARGLAIGGFSDWYMPARQELAVIYTNRTAISGADAIDTDSTYYYWTSTENSGQTGSAWARGFFSDFQTAPLKSNPHRVRAVRRIAI